MAKYKQGYSARKDESMGMRNGAEKYMKQSYKSRRDESYGMKEMNYDSTNVMGHEKMPKECNAFMAQKADLSRMEYEPVTNRGYPEQAWDYKY